MPKGCFFPSAKFNIVAVIISVECSPQVSLDFEDNPFDSNTAVHSRNVKVESGVGKFEGGAMITLWRFTGYG